MSIWHPRVHWIPASHHGISFAPSEDPKTHGGKLIVAYSSQMTGPLYQCLYRPSGVKLLTSDAVPKVLNILCPPLIPYLPGTVNQMYSVHYNALFLLLYTRASISTIPVKLHDSLLFLCKLSEKGRFPYSALLSTPFSTDCCTAQNSVVPPKSHRFTYYYKFQQTLARTWKPTFSHALSKVHHHPPRLFSLWKGHYSTTLRFPTPPDDTHTPKPSKTPFVEFHHFIILRFSPQIL